MAVNTFDKYSKKIQTRFNKESLIVGRLTTDFDFSGVKTVRVITPQTVPLVDYTRTGASRYGTPTEVQDVVQEMTLSQDKAFAMTVDKGNNIDQGYLKAAARVLKQEVEEICVPEMDKYCFEQLAAKAGKIVGNSTALTTATVCTKITTGTEWLDDEEFPQENRTLFVPSNIYALLRLSAEFQKCENLLEKSLAKGQVGTYDGMPVVKVPKGRWPANVNFIIVHKSAACAPVKLSETKIHRDPPGISGNLLEGRQYYDLFVFGAKCDGVYVEVCTASGKGVVCATPTESSGTFASSTTGASFKYTADGSDPRYSPTAIAAASESETAGATIKVFAYKANCYNSEVFTYTAS